MMKYLSAIALMISLSAVSAGAQWPEPQRAPIPEADGYVPIPGVAVPPTPDTSYRFIVDATKGAARPSDLVPALNQAGSELNAFAAAKVPRDHVHAAVVFHGAATDALLDDEHYRAKFGVPNPNLAVLEQFRTFGVELLVCGQYLAAQKIDPASLSRTVAVASDALIVLITYQNRGYALLSF